MPLRTVLLRVLFGSLAIAACFGVMGVLFGSHDTLWRVSGTSIATAFASLLLFGVSFKMDKPPARSAALLAFTLVVAEYLITLAAIWVVDGVFGSTYSDSLWLTVLFVILVGVPAIVLMRLTTIKLTALAGRVGLVLAAVQLSLLLIIAWTTRMWASTWAVDDVAGSLAIFAPMALICLVGADMQLRHLWRWVGVLAAAVGFTIAAYGSIRQIHDGGNVFVYVICVAAAFAHANIVILFRVRSGQMWLRWLTIAAGVGTAFCIASSTYLGPDYTDIPDRLAGAAAILAGCGTIALAVLAKLNRRVVIPNDAMTGLSQITVICPLCRKKQTIPLGAGQCADCHVLINVRVEEPRCATCGYSLLMLNSGVCPECGTRVTDAPTIVDRSAPSTPVFSSPAVFDDRK